MADIKFECTGCRKNCEIEIDFHGQEDLEIKGNGCMRGMLYAQEKVKNAAKEK